MDMLEDVIRAAKGMKQDERTGELQLDDWLPAVHPEDLISRVATLSLSLEL